jgi:2-polyprenyl-3-methyl-5-hydroxy-6-metoxy-1,4-benzoquinol methylase
VTVLYSGSTAPVIDEHAAFRCTTNTLVRPEVLQCGDCDHVFSNPSTWPPSLSDAYEGLSDPDYLDIIHAKRRTFRRAADVVQRLHPRRGTVVEVGSYAGLFLDEMASRGYSVTGVEPSRWGADVARGRGHNVVQGTIESLAQGIPGAPFDIVVSWDVLEHVEDPRAMMRTLAEWTKPGGTMVLSTLDRGNWFAKRTGGHWPWIIPMHLHYFDQAAVKSMAADNGLVFVETGAHVHYTSVDYLAGKFIPTLARRHERPSSKFRDTLNSLVFPVGFGDVRMFAFRKPAA